MVPGWPALGLAGSEAAPAAGPCAHRGGGVNGEGRGHGAYLHNGPARATGEVASVPGVGSGLESAAAAPGRRERRRPRALGQERLRDAGAQVPHVPPGARVAGQRQRSAERCPARRRRLQCACSGAAALHTRRCAR